MEWWSFRSRVNKAEKKTDDSYYREPESITSTARLFNLQQTFGNQAVQRMITNQADGKGDSLNRNAGREGGQALPRETRETMEARFGEDFNNVRIHADDEAEASATALQSSAFTVGRDIYFARGMYAPQQPDGQCLIAHELAHVVQQGKSSETPSQDRGLAQAPQHAEQAAEAASRAVARGDSVPTQPGQQLQLARQTYPAPRPASGSDPPNPAPPKAEAPRKKEPVVTPSPPEEKKEKKEPSRPRAPVGKYGMFGDKSPTPELRRWNYVVYDDHVRLGNRAVDESGSGTVIGSLPWMTNNPGDLTVDVKPRKENPNDENSEYRQDVRVWGRPISRGKSPDTLAPVSGSTGLSAANTAIEGFAARKDLAIFATRERGRGALKEWIQKYYKDMTLAGSVKAHLGPASSHVPGVDDPEKYPVILQQYLSDKKYPSNYVNSTLCKDIKEEEWNDVIDAFALAEGMYSRRAVPGEKGKFKYYENKGVIYRCAGRDAIDVDPAYQALGRVKNMPQATPPEIKELLGCE
jgi:hypothetical protein